MDVLGVQVVLLQLIDFLSLGDVHAGKKRKYYFLFPLLCGEKDYPWIQIKVKHVFKHYGPHL